MIYGSNKIEKPFDDTIIRSVDSLVNSVFYSDHNEKAKDCLTLEQYSAEYRTIILKLPRQCGKTVYLKKLMQHFKNSTQYSVNLIVPKLEMKSNLYHDSGNVYTPNEFSDKYHWGSADKNYPDILLYDELSNKERYLPAGKIFTLGLYT